MSGFSYFVLFALLFSKIVGENFFTHADFQREANIQSEFLYEQGDRDYIAFWEKCAQNVDWFQPWEKVLEWNKPYAKWFVSGKLNIAYNCLDRHIANGNGNKIALICADENGSKQCVTYMQLLQEVNRIANTMKQMGVKKGDRVAIYMPMIHEGIASMLACCRIGAVHTVIFGGIGPQSVKNRILDSEAKLLITADGSYRAGKIIAYKSHLDEILEECPTIQNVIVLKHTHNATSMKKGRDYWYSDVVGKSSNICPPEIMDAEDPLFILYTSGTTGKPKGIIHTTGGYLVGVHTTFLWVFDIKPQDIYWSTADIGWITGHSFVVYAPLSNGVTQVIYEGAFDYPAKNQFAKIIDDNKVSIFYTAPTLIRMFMKWGDECKKGASLDSLRLLGSIGEPINPESWFWYHNTIGKGKCPIVDTWFQTETGQLVISPIPGLTPLLPGTVTRALPGHDVAVLDEEGNPSSKGLLAIRKPFPAMMRGIYKDHDRYVSTYWSRWGGKYYFAGDAAICDEYGYFWIGGRCDEVLKVSGHRIGTAEVENALIEHPAVSESAAVGIKDAIKGEKILAFVILKDGVAITASLEEELKKSVATYLGSYARPEKVVIVNKLPKTRSGKILRRVLKNLVEGSSVGDVSTLSDPSCMEELIEKCQKLNREFFPKSDQNGELLNACAAKPHLSALANANGLSVQEIVKIVQPLLKDHLIRWSYDRLHGIADFLEFYATIQSEGSPVNALAKFQPNTRLDHVQGGTCCALTQHLFEQIPLKNKSVIPAVLPKKFQQKGWMKYAHTAIAIPYASKGDHGIVLLDPNFDIEIPIVLKKNDSPVPINMKGKGIWKFQWHENQILCSDNSGVIMTYLLQEYHNPVAAALRSMIACDRRIAMVSRDCDGNQKAHINVQLDRGTITWAHHEKREEPFSFHDFLSGQKRWSDTFAKELGLSANDLHALVKAVIQGKPVLDRLANEFLDLVESSDRKNDFF